MKHCVLIIDGASGWPLPERGSKTCLELAQTPNLDAMAQESKLGLIRTIPLGLEPSSSCACISVLGYDPTVRYPARAAIEARGMDINIDAGDAVFRCNLTAVRDGKMWSFNSGQISTEEAHQLVAALEEELGSDTVHFYPGVSYRHICKIKGREDTLLATCTPPHDIPNKPIKGFLPKGPGSDLLRDLMKRSEAVLQNHPVNVDRRSRGEIPATMIWLFWGSDQLSDIPAFKKIYGLSGAVTSAVDIIRGLARIIEMEVLDIPGVKDGMDNDFTAQAAGALAALKEYDLVVIHVEATDEAAHAGSIDDKVEVIQRVDREIVSQLRRWQPGDLRLLIMPDHSTPIKIQTHTDDPVPFMLWGAGFTPNGARRFTEAEAKNTGFFIESGYTIMSRLVRM